MKNEKATRYCAELDIKHFYPNIKPRHVVDSLKRIIKDRRVIDLAERIIRQGILIGFYTSQWFANLVLQDLDELIRRYSTHYIRYMDNMTIFHSNKRKLRKLVEEKFVSGWDDPRMPTLCGVRRRGYTPEALKMFCEKIGVSKRDQLMDIQLLEWCVRQDLNARSNRYMVVQDPVKVVLTNWPEGQVEWYDCPLNPAEPEGACRKVPFTGALWIERADFMEDAPNKFFRLKPDGEVRLKYTYIIKCNEVVKDDSGNVVELRCTYDPSTKPGAGEWRSVKGTIHWVSCDYARDVELRNYDRLFTLADMSQVPEDKDYKDYLNPDSLCIAHGLAEPALLEDTSGVAVQFERTGYYIQDKDSAPGKPVFNKTVSLKDSYKPE